MKPFYKSVLVWSKNLFITFYTLRLLPSSLGQGILINANRKLCPNSISPPLACFCQQVVTFFVSHIFRSHIFSLLCVNVVFKKYCWCLSLTWIGCNNDVEDFPWKALALSAFKDFLVNWPHQDIYQTYVMYTYWQSCFDK